MVYDSAFVGIKYDIHLFISGIGRNITKSAGNSTNDAKPTNIAAEGSRARAMNFTSAFQDGMHNNEMEMVTRMHAKEHSIDDVSMDDIDDDNNLNFANFTFNPQTAGGGGGGKGSGYGNESSNSKKSTASMTKNANSGTCTDRDGKVYKLGEKFTKGCDETCQCQKDGVVCSQQCKMPYVVKGRNRDPHCDEEPVEGSTCCVRLVCSTVQDLGKCKNIEPFLTKDQVFLTLSQILVYFPNKNKKYERAPKIIDFRIRRYPTTYKLTGQFENIIYRSL